MIKINNSENFFLKLKNLFTSSNIAIEKKDIISEEVQDINNSISNKNEQTIEKTSITNKRDINSTFNKVETIPDYIPTVLSSDTECLKKLQNPQTIMEYKRILFKIDKSKFQYPFLKDTELITYLNLPIVKNVQYIQEKNQKTYTLNIDKCPDAKGYYTVDYISISANLLVDFSVALYKHKTITQSCPDDINNLDIYGFESDSLLTQPFEFCYTGEVINFTPFDFSVELTTTTPLVEPVCEFDDYYLYEVDVNVSISLLPNIILSSTDSKTLKALNEAIGNTDLTNNKFTRGQLASITELNLSNNPNLTYEVFPYLINLKKLIARNNYIKDYTFLENIISLEYVDLSNDTISTTSTNLLNTFNFVDITPLTKLINLKYLDLSNNDIQVIPEDISNLVDLETLILDNNNIVDLSNLSSLSNLQTLSLQNNPFDPTTLPPIQTITFLDLSNTNLTNDGLRDITISDNLLKLDISNNQLTNLSSLNGYNLTVIATNQKVNLGTLHPDEDGMFILDLSFLRNIDFSIPEVSNISNNGSYCDDESCYEPSIIWENITFTTNASFEFANTSGSFTGTVNVILDPNPS